jgi:fimbrial chaperone protein
MRRPGLELIRGARSIEPRWLLNAIIFLLVIVLLPSVGDAGQFRVAPIRLDFDHKARSGVINVINEGQDPLQVQMKAYEWTQDAAGKDKYVETQDIIFLPRIMRIEQDETRLVRAGIRVPATTKEKTYRLFIEEIPDATQKAPGAQIKVAIRFGVPVFAKPLQETLAAEIDEIKLAGGTVSVAVKNAGNTHVFTRSITIRALGGDGAETFSQELSGWYQLAGVSRSYSRQSPKTSACVHRTSRFR